MQIARRIVPMTQALGFILTTLKKIIAGTTNPAEKTYQRLLNKTCLHQTAFATAINDLRLSSTRVARRHINLPEQGLPFDVATSCLLGAYTHENKERSYVIAA